MNMELYKAECIDLAQSALGNPQTSWELVGMLTAGLLAFFLALLWAGRAFKCAMAEPGRTAASVLLGAVTLAAAALVAQVHLAPLLDNATGGWILVGAASALALLLLVVPAVRFLLKGAYPNVLAALLVALAATAAVMLMARATLRTVQAGGREADSMRQRSQRMGEQIE